MTSQEEIYNIILYLFPVIVLYHQGSHFEDRNRNYNVFNSYFEDISFICFLKKYANNIDI